MSRRLLLATLLLAALLAARLCHKDIIWVEEAYPAAAAIQMADHGKRIYRDFWFDKPPGAPYFYLLFGAATGAPLRIAGALFVLACSALAFLAALRFWRSEAIALTAAGLLAFFLTFDHPAAILAIAPDLLMVLPSLAALYFVAAGRFAWAGFACGLAFWINPKAVFLAAGLVIWTRSLRLAACALLPAFAMFAVYWQGWHEQVFEWGRMYSADSPFTVLDGVRKAGEWIWFHLTLCAGAGIAIIKERANRHWLALLLLSFAAVCLGARFFPRYFFQLLPVLALLAARGLFITPERIRTLLFALLLIPAVRFGRVYPQLAADLWHGREHSWNQIALYQDSRAAADILRREAKAGDTLFVWGYRPDVLMLTRMPLGAPYLDSQPLSGVLADRHLVSATRSAAPREAGIRATWVVDGLGPVNPALAFRANGYREVARTAQSIVYRRIQ